MNFGEVDFCPDMDNLNLNAKRVSELLAAELFDRNETVRNLFEARYDQMKRNYLDVRHGDSKWNLNGLETDKTDKAALLSVPRERLGNCGGLVERLWDFHNFGHDMPTWMAKRGGQRSRRVMIVSQDPLRTNHGPERLVLSTPFGFHSADYRQVKCENPILFRMVDRILDDCGACVYLTDCRKFFVNGPTMTFKLMNERSYRTAFKKVLDEEMTMFDPEAVVTLGNEAADYVGAKQPKAGVAAQTVNGRTVVASYHPGVRPRHLRRFSFVTADRPYDAYFGKIVEEIQKLLR